MWERVHTINDFYDAPRFGVADYEGSPCIYESSFDESLDDYSDDYRLTRIDQELFELICEDWKIWRRWEDAFQKGEVDLDSHPCLPADGTKHAELLAKIGDRFKTDQDNHILRKAKFRMRSKQPRELEVKWSSDDA